MRRRPTTLVRSLIAAALAVALTGCAPDGIASTGSTQDVPDFSGPWAAVFSSTYASAATDIVREVLKDSKISDAEWADVKNGFETCMSDRGIPLTWDDDFGGFSLEGNTKDNAHVDDALKTCGASFDAISMLRYATTRNPDNVDESELVVACFIRDGVVDPGYTAKQYDIDSSANPRPAWLDSAKTLTCGRDPLGLLD